MAKLHFVKNVERTFLHQGDPRHPASKLGLEGWEQAQALLLAGVPSATFCYAQTRPEVLGSFTSQRSTMFLQQLGTILVSPLPPYIPRWSSDKNRVTGRFLPTPSSTLCIYIYMD